MSDRFRQLASQLTVPEALIMRNRLADEGIYSSLEYLEVVWCLWHYTNAVGGVKLAVNESDWDAACRAVLHVEPPLRQPGADELRCTRCSAERDATWDICWCCGAGSESPLAPESPGELPFDPTKGTRTMQFISAAVCLLLTLVFIAYGLVATLLASLAVLVMGMTFREFRLSKNFDEDPQFLSESMPEIPDNLRTRVAERTLHRACRLAAVGFFFFPPLAIGSTRLLRRLRRRRLLLTEGARWRAFGAGAANAGSMVLLAGISAVTLLIVFRAGIEPFIDGLIHLVTRRDTGF